MKILCMVLAIFLSGVVCAKNDSAAGKTKSASCMACHGANGISINDMWPNLKGQKKGYLVKQMKNFKSGVRKEPLMDALIKGLSDQDMQDIASYFSSMK